MYIYILLDHRYMLCVYIHLMHMHLYLYVCMRINVYVYMYTYNIYIYIYIYTWRGAIRFIHRKYEQVLPKAACFPNRALLIRVLTLIVIVQAPDGGPPSSPGSAQLGSPSRSPSLPLQIPQSQIPEMGISKTKFAQAKFAKTEFSKAKFAKAKFANFAKLNLL